MTTRWAHVFVALGAVSALTATAACGSSAPTDGPWQPDGAVELMVAGSPGGGSDLVTRTLQQDVSQRGVTTEVRNYDPIEAYIQLKAQPEDPELLLTANYGGAVLTPAVQGLDYSWEDFTPIALVGVDASYVVTTADSPFRTIDDVVTQARAGRVTIGQTATGGQDARATQQLAEATGIDLEPVVFEGGGQQLAATLAGDVDISVLEPTEFVDQAEAGAVRPLVVLSENEPPSGTPLADVPTATEAGLQGQFSAQWRGFFAAPGISPEQRSWWEEQVRAWVESDAYDSYVKSSLMTRDLRTGAEFETFLRESAASVGQG